MATSGKSNLAYRFDLTLTDVLGILYCICPAVVKILHNLSSLRPGR